MAHNKQELPVSFIEMPYTRLKELLLSIHDKKAQAFLSLAYASYARIGEVTLAHIDGKVNPQCHPPNFNDVSIIKPQGQTTLFIKIRLFTLKQGKDLARRTRYAYVSRENERWLFDIITKWWFQQGKEKTKTTEPLFQGNLNKPISPKWPHRWFKEYIAKPCGLNSENIHLLRSWRASHASKGAFTKDGKPYPIEAQMQEGGWKTATTPMQYYIKARSEDYLKLR